MGSGEVRHNSNAHYIAVFPQPFYALFCSPGSTSIYVLLLIYAASTATTTIPCLAVILSTPVSPTPLSGISVTAEQRLLLLSSYIPFCLVPLVMTFDMASRVQKLIGAGGDAQKEKRE